MRFQELLSRMHAGNPERQQTRARQRFPEEVHSHGFRLWQPGDRYSASGVRFLLGVAAAYSVTDLRLLDDLDTGIRERRFKSGVIDVFDSSGIQKMQEFESYIPGITPVVQSPVLGVWVNGELKERLQGFHVRRRLLRELGEDM
jgi:hypothetical protein